MPIWEIRDYPFPATVAMALAVDLLSADEALGNLLGVSLSHSSEIRGAVNGSLSSWRGLQKTRSRLTGLGAFFPGLRILSQVTLY